MPSRGRFRHGHASSSTVAERNAFVPLSSERVVTEAIKNGRRGLDGLRGAFRRKANRSRKRRRIVVICVTTTVVALVAAGTIIWLPWRSTHASPTSVTQPSPAPTRRTPTSTPMPLTPAESLLASSHDPNACAVSFAGEGIVDAPILETVDTLYTGLPLPTRDGAVFAGWYTSAADAAAFTAAERVNGSKVVACSHQQITLHAGWMTPEVNVAENAHIPILMYHQFTTNPDGESGWLRGNYAYIGDFDEQMSYIASGGFYQPTWDELSAFIDGKLFLPDHSVIVTDDDADQTWFDLAAPVVEKGEMVNISADQIAADLETSSGVLGVKEVIAYPFGHYTETAKQGVAQAGFELARTIDPGYVTIGTDKLALPVQRINYGMGVNALQRMIG